MSTLTNFPNGVQSFGLPVLGNAIPTVTGSVFWVDSGNALASTVAPGTFDHPMSTIDSAIGKCVAANGDLIVVKEGHAETLSTAGAIAIDISGVTIIGLGVGDNRPTLTFSNTAATIAQSANNTKFLNFILTPSVDSVVSPLAVTGDGCEFDVVVKDASDAVECVRGVLATGADRLKGKIQYLGRTGGDACVNGVRLVGCSNVELSVDFYGKASTSCVEFLTTACTGVNVSGYIYNSGTTNGSKDIIDTVTGSTWYGYIYDGAAGAVYSGGSASAFASDDASTIASNQTVPTADSSANTLSRDVVGNKADTALYAPNSTGSLAAYNRGLIDLADKTVQKSPATITNGQTLFTVAGGHIEILSLTSVCVTGNNSTASTLQYSADGTDGSATNFSGASASLANATAGTIVALDGTSLATAPNVYANGVGGGQVKTVIVPAGVITAVVGVGSTTGTWSHNLRYRPLARGVTVT